MISFQIFDQYLNVVVKDLKGDHKILASCGESESSILANVLGALKESPSSELTRYIERFQDKYDNSTKIDLDNWMRKIVMKYESLVEDAQWDTKSEKDFEILALASHIQEF